MIGSERMRRPVAWYTAFAIAAETPKCRLAPRFHIELGLDAPNACRPVNLGSTAHRIARDRTGSVQRCRLCRSADSRELIALEDEAGGRDVFL